MKTSTKTSTINPITIARLQRQYDAAITAEENAETEAQAWRLALVSERILRDLQAAKVGAPLPTAVRKATLSAKKMASMAFASLAAIGRAIEAAQAATVAAPVVTEVVSETGSTRVVATMNVTGFARTYNRVPERSTVRNVTFTAPTNACVEELIELAHEAGLSRGDRTIAGVFELQTDHGIWACPDQSKLLSRTGIRLSDKATFKSWDVIETEEVAS